MPSRWSRRRLLRLGVLGLGSALAGCSGAGSGDSPNTDDGSTGNTTSPGPTATDTATPPFAGETPAPGECDAVDRPTPTPTAEGLEPMAYPDYPDSLTAEAAESFVDAYERAHRHNEFLADEFVRGTDEVTIEGGVPTGMVTEYENGYVVGFDGTMYTSDNRQPETSTATQAPAGNFPVGAWYYLTDRFALRNGVQSLEEAESPEFGMATTVVCDRG